jgi:hypothetical protein
MLDHADLIRRAWPVFLEAIREGRTITYTELAARVGPPLHRRHLHRQLLTPLSARCRAARLPDLSALIVRQDTGMPGFGWHGPVPTADPSRTWADALAECYAHRWSTRPDPRLLRPTSTGAGDAMN